MGKNQIDEKELSKKIYEECILGSKTQKNFCKESNIGRSFFDKLLDEYFNTTKPESVKLSVRLVDKTHVLIGGMTITAQQIYNDYIVKNMSAAELSQKYQVSIHNFRKIISFFKFKKDFKKVEEVRQKNLIKRYGINNVSQLNSSKTKKKNSALIKYGVDNVSKALEVKNKKTQTFLEHYGMEFFFQTEEFKQYTKEYWLNKAGCEHSTQVEGVKQKIQKTNLAKYGLPWACMRKEAKITHGQDSKPNTLFQNILEQKYPQIFFEREFTLDRYFYDFKIDNIFFEINPTFTHNILWGPFGKEHLPRVTKDYHEKKSYVAKENGYFCIHIWDWDNSEELLKLFFNDQQQYIDRFIKKIENENDIIIYCDNAKVDKTIFLKQGFQEIESICPVKHWCNLNTKEHIVDWQEKYDNDVMVYNEFLPVYDCGYTILRKNKVN